MKDVSREKEMVNSLQGFVTTLEEVLPSMLHSDTESKYNYITKKEYIIFKIIYKINIILHDWNV